ncbi:MAG: hypothetical protein K8J08_09090, partial [Thermoanaerobaculia bacterium]|nr:hypothetical protein [Thermoanaerobaculia bacterium]
GLAVVPVVEAWTAENLAQCDLLAAVSPRGAGRGQSLADRGNPAYEEMEIDALESWLIGGGGLLLVTDHAPIGGAVETLAGRLGINVSNSFTEDPEHADPDGGYLVYSRSNGLLTPHPITDGTGPDQAVQRIGVFLGQSLAGPPGAISFLTLGAAAQDRYRVSRRGFWLDPSPQDSLRSAAGRSQGLAMRFGSGRVVALGDAAMLTALGSNSGFDTEGLDNQKLAVNILRWLSGMASSQPPSRPRR